MSLDAVTILQALGIGLTLLGAAVMASAALLGPAHRPFRVVRRQVRCPAGQTTATVDFLLSTVRGVEVIDDVVRCSLRADDVRVGCGRECRSSGVAPFGTAG